MTLYTLSTETGTVYVHNVQVISFRGEMYQHQRRYADEGGAELVGHFMVDDWDNFVEMRGNHLPDFKRACASLYDHNVSKGPGRRPIGGRQG